MKQVTIHLNSRIEQAGQKDVIDKTYQGSIVEKNGSIYIRYHDEDTNQVTLKYDIALKQLTVLWEKHAVKRIVFQENSINQMQYHLPQGALLFDVHTKQLDTLYTQDNLTHLKLVYVLKQDDNIVGRYRLAYKIEHV